jgi:hypothetical protein
MGVHGSEIGSPDVHATIDVIRDAILRTKPDATFVAIPVTNPGPQPPECLNRACKRKGIRPIFDRSRAF